MEAVKVALYSSIYKAALALDKNPGVTGMYNGKYRAAGMQSNY